MVLPTNLWNYSYIFTNSAFTFSLIVSLMHLLHRFPPYGLETVFWLLGMFFIFIGLSLAIPFKTSPHLAHLAFCGFLSICFNTVLPPGVFLNTLLKVLDLNLPDTIIIEIPDPFKKLSFCHYFYHSSDTFKYLLNKIYYMKPKKKAKVSRIKLSLISSLIISFLLLMPIFCFAVKLQDENNILKFSLSEHTVISPGLQKLTINIEKPLISTPKDFELRLSINGPALFENDKKLKILQTEEISENIIKQETIKIESSASNQGDDIKIEYSFKYKSSSFGKIDENFKEFNGSLSFKGASSDTAFCEQELTDCNAQKQEFLIQIDDYQKSIDLNLEKKLKQDLSDCQTNTKTKQNKLIILSTLLALTTILFLVLWLKDKIKKKKFHHHTEHN